MPVSYTHLDVYKRQVQSHDSSQRANGFLAFFGGLLIMFAKEILDFITV